MTITAKVSIIDPQSRQDLEEVSSKSETIDAQVAAKSQYAKVQKDDWKALTTPIGEMMNEINGIRESSAYKGPVDAILDSMVLNDPVVDTAYMTQHTLPEVPNVLDIFKETPGLQNDVAPVVERYETLKDTLEELRTNALLSLKQPMASSEIKSTQKFVEDLEKSLTTCNEQLETAKYYLYIQRIREKKVREASD